MKNLTASLICCISLLPISAIASSFSGSVSVGAAFSTGNTETDNKHFSLNASKSVGVWKHSVLANYRESKFGDITTSDKTFGSYAAHYALHESKSSQLFGYVSFEKNEFSNIDSRIPIAFGYGKSTTFSEGHKLYTQVGAGYMQTEYTSGGDDEGAIGFLGVAYQNKLSKSTTLTQDLTLLAGEDNTSVHSVTGLKVAMTEKLSLKLGYNVRHNTDVAPSIKKTDASTNVSIALSF